MLDKELSCIEVLLNHLINDVDLDSAIFSEFSSTKTFATKKTSIFNILTINNILKNYTENPPFPLDQFLFYGSIPGEYESTNSIPMADPTYLSDPKEFVDNLVEALREGNYLFDEDGNIFISSNKLEATIPQSWLYKLSEGYKRKKFSKLYFYNKNQEADISDKISLIDYLRHTKTFLVSLTSKDASDYEIEFAKAEALTNNDVKNESVVRVEDLIKIFKSKVSRNYQTRIERYKLTDLFFIVSKAEKLGQEFYSKPLEEQKKDINNWIVDFINSNEKANEAAQEYVLLVADDNEPKLDKKEVIIGLLNLYLDLISRYDFDYNDVSLTDLKIGTYLPEKLQSRLNDKKILIQAINRLSNERASIKRQLDIQNAVLDSLTLSDGAKFNKTRDRIKALVEGYQQLERAQKDYQKTYNYLQETIRNDQKESMLDISFANDEIMQLLMIASKIGRIYISNGNIVNFETYNTEIGKTTFKASISTYDLLTLIENINYSIGEKNYSMKN